MFCSHCGAQTPPGAAFCDYCGSPLSGSSPGESAGATEPIGQRPAWAARQPLAQRRPQRQPIPGGQTPGKAANADPRRQQLRALRLQLKQRRIELQQVNMQLQQIHNQQGQGAPFVPWGIANRIYREVGNIELSGPQQRKQQLQQEIISLQQQILALESQMGTNQP
jgi:hypothetical protein